MEDDDRVPRLEFHNNLQWVDAYQRNNKSNGQKNLRCFPNHCQGLGHQPGFCGHSIIIDFSYSIEELKGAKLYSFAHFAVAESELESPALVGARGIQRREYSVGDVVPEHQIKDKVRLADMPLREYIEGLELQERRPLSNDRERVSFEFNRNLKGWHYGFHGSKLTRNVLHNFRAYVVQQLGNGQCRILAEVASPPWKLFCRRRKRPGIKKGAKKATKSKIEDEEEDDEENFLTVSPPLPPCHSNIFANQPSLNRVAVPRIKKRRGTTPDAVLCSESLFGPRALSPRRFSSHPQGFGENVYYSEESEMNNNTADDFKTYLRRLSSQKRLAESGRQAGVTKRTSNPSDHLWTHDSYYGEKPHQNGSIINKQRLQLLMNVILLIHVPFNRNESEGIKLKNGVHVDSFAQEVGEMLDFWIHNAGSHSSLDITRGMTPDVSGFANFLLVQDSFASALADFGRSQAFAERKDDPYAVLSFIMRTLKVHLRMFIRTRDTDAESKTLEHTFSTVSLKNLQGDDDLEQFTQGLDALSGNNESNLKFLGRFPSRMGLVSSPTTAAMKGTSFFGGSFLHNLSGFQKGNHSSLNLMSFLNPETSKRNGMEDLDDFLEKEGVTNVEEVEVV